MRPITNIATLFLLFLLSPFHANLAHAFAEGKWSGSGELELPLNSTLVDCNSVELEFRQSESVLALRDGSANCDWYQFSYPSLRFRIEDGVLFYNRTAVGMIGTDYAHFFFQLRNGNLNIVDIRIVEDSLELTHTQSNWGTTENVFRAVLIQEQ